VIAAAQASPQPRGGRVESWVTAHPVAGASAELIDAPYSEHGDRVLLASATTDASGVFRMPSPPPGGGVPDHGGGPRLSSVH